MVKNKIKVLRAGVGISQAALAEKMPDDVGKIAMNFIEAGRCLPTRASLETMCEVFACSPADLYDIFEIDLAAVGRKPEAKQIEGSIPAPAAKGAGSAKVRDDFFIERSAGRNHEGMEEVRVWFPIAEKAALKKVVRGLGYHSIAEWMREKYRQAINQYIELKIADDITSDTLRNTTSPDLNAPRNQKG